MHSVLNVNSYSYKKEQVLNELPNSRINQECSPNPLLISLASYTWLHMSPCQASPNFSSPEMPHFLNCLNTHWQFLSAQCWVIDNFTVCNCFFSGILSRGERESAFRSSCMTPNTLKGGEQERRPQILNILCHFIDFTFGLHFFFCIFLKCGFLPC